MPLLLTLNWYLSTWSEVTLVKFKQVFTPDINLMTLLIR